MGLEPHIDDIETIDDTISGLELHSKETKHVDIIKEDPQGVTISSSSSSSSELQSKETRHVDISNEDLLGGTMSSSSSSSSSELHSKEMKHVDICNGDLLRGTISSSSSSTSLSSSSSTTSLKKLDCCNKDDTPQWSMMSATPRAGSSAHSSSELLPPNHPRMNRPPGYDPNRIPSHVFSSRANTPEWSVASNDSLFSIHMGNGSFSRELIFPMSEVGGKGGGDTTKPEECSNNTIPQPEAKLPPVFEAASKNDNKLTLDEQDSQVFLKEESDTETLQEKHKGNQAPSTQEVGFSNSPPPSNLLEGKGSPSNLLEGKGSPSNLLEGKGSPVTPRASNESATSTGSFAFPLLVDEVGKNASLKAIDEEKHDEVQPQNQTTDTVPKAGSSWFSCFTNWPRCC